MELRPSEELEKYLKEAEKEDIDIIVCFHHGTLANNPEKDWGHACIFDRIIDGGIRIIDPSPHYPKWRVVTFEKMFEAMQKHGEKEAAGFWEFRYTV